MNRNPLIQFLTPGLVFMLVFAILAAQSCTQKPTEKVEEGSYTPKRTATPEYTPEYLVTGVALDQLSEAHFADMETVTEGLVGQWGRVRTLFHEKDKKQVTITVAVYGGVSEAEDAALELLNSVSVVLEAGSKSGGVIGTRSWYLESPDGSGVVVFVHNNSLFQLFSSDYDVAETSGRSIAEDLVYGRNGVRLGTKVYVPEITDVEIPFELTPEKETSMSLKATDPHQRKLSFFASASKGRLVETEKSDERIYIPVEAGTDELSIYAINDMNVVSQVYIKKIEVEE